MVLRFIFVRSVKDKTVSDEICVCGHFLMLHVLAGECRSRLS
jgi:hypothetical protein